MLNFLCDDINGVIFLTISLREIGLLKTKGLLAVNRRVLREVCKMLRMKALHEQRLNVE